MPSMMIAVSPKTLRKRSLSCVLKPLMWASIRVWSSAGGLLGIARNGNGLRFAEDIAKSNRALRKPFVSLVKRRMRIRIVKFDLSTWEVEMWFRDQQGSGTAGPGSNFKLRHYRIDRGLANELT